MSTLDMARVHSAGPLPGHYHLAGTPWVGPEGTKMETKRLFLDLLR